MLRYILLIVLLIPVFPAGASAARCTVSDVTPPVTTVLPEREGMPLVLNGMGARTKLFWNVYVSALYLPQRSTNVAEILAMPGPKRVWLHFLRRVSAEKLLEGWRDGFEGNNTAAQFTALAERLENTYPLFRDMNEGDTLVFDYLPGVGTRLRINGQNEVTVHGEDFYRSVLKVWLGERPAQEPLKSCLLGVQSQG